MTQDPATGSAEPGPPAAAPGRRARALCLCSGGLDSLLCLCVLRDQGVEAEAVSFVSPFYADPAPTARTCAELGFKFRTVDFTDDILALLRDPPSGFGSCLNPCIDCHARMIARAFAIAQEEGYDFVATGEVLGQRPMSQQRGPMNRVRNLSGAGDRLLRPLSAKLMEPTAPEKEGLLDRERLLALQGRNRKPQMELAKKYGIRHYPSPAGGCKLTEPNYCRRLKDLMDHEGLGDARLLQACNHGRHFRFPGGTLVVLGRDKADNEFLRTALRGGDATFRPVNVPGPTALAVRPAADDVPAVRRLVAAYSDTKGVDEVAVRELFAASKPAESRVPPSSRDEFAPYLL
ncbi:MAG: tRNA 4-thiouridine(8) synthase ThiI [Kiritimatiellae bacterium]|nr:tRNA 4-thiouridine(8) synthase ThiI [Kiritimatiellia bacterium]